MKETNEDIESLQKLVNSSIEQAGIFLRSSFQMPEHSLSARQLVRYLQGIKIVALATVTAQGEPRVAPVGSIFYRGQFHILSVAKAARARHIEKRSAISLAHFEGNDLAIIVHGNGHILKPNHPDFAEIESIQKEVSGNSVQDWGEGVGVYIRVVANALYTFARYPQQMAE